MTHLGMQVTDLVDGQLGAEATERAHAHLAGCLACREAVEAERLMKARLAFLSDPDLGADFVARLLALGGPSGPLPPREGHVPGSPRRPFAVVARPTGRPEPGRLRDSVRPSGRSSVRLRDPWLTEVVAGRARLRWTGAFLGVVGVVGMGGLALVVPSVSTGKVPGQPVDSVVIGSPTGGIPVPAAELVGNGWTDALTRGQVPAGGLGYGPTTLDAVAPPVSPTASLSPDVGAR